MSPKKPTQDSTNLPLKCQYAEIVQYQCQLLEPNRVVCVPFTRLFKKCEGKPTIEVTPVYEDIVYSEDLQPSSMFDYSSNMGFPLPPGITLTENSKQQKQTKTP